MTYIYPNGLTVAIPDRWSDVRPPTLQDLHERGFDPRVLVAVNVDGVCRVEDGQYIKPPKTKWPYPSTDAYRRAMCATDGDQQDECLLNPRLLPDSLFAECVTIPRGYTWETSLFGPGPVGGRRQEYWPIARNTRHWLGSQVIAADIDHGMPWSQAREVMARHGLHPTFAYDSGSCTCPHGDHDRYRVVVVLDEVVTDLGVAKRLSRGLTVMLGGDAASADVTHVFYGGKSLIASEFGRRVSVREFEESLWSAKLPSLSTRTNLSSARARHRAGLGMVRGAATPGAGGEEEGGGRHTHDSEYESGRVNVDSIESARIVLHFDGVVPASGDESFPASATLPATRSRGGRPAAAFPRDAASAARVPDLAARLESECRLWCDFAGGDSPGVGDGDHGWLSYGGLFHLYSNLTAIRGGESLFREVLRRVHGVHPDWVQYDPRRWGREKKQSLACPPSRCDAESCPHAAECPSRGLTIVDAARGLVGSEFPVAVEERSVVTLQEGEALLREAVEAAIATDDDRIHGVVAPTGTGKTETYIRYIREHGGRYLIAVPTHALAVEVQRRLVEAGVPAGRRPELPVGHPFDAELRHLHDLGAHGAAAKLVREEASTVPALRDYLRQCEEAEAADMLIVTHAYLPHLLIKHGTGGRRVIVDEDPLPTLVRCGQVSLSALGQMREPVAGESAEVGELVEDLWRAVTDAPQGQIATLRPVPDDLETAWYALAKRAIAHVGDADADRHNVLDLFRAERIAVEGGVVSHARLLRLPEHAGLVVLSATLDGEICRRAFGDRVVLHEVPDVALAGRLVQHAGSSMSRQVLRRMTEEERAALAAEVGDAPTITYAKWKGEFETPAGMHFGNVEGIDVLAGSDLNVVGTWNLNPTALHLMAAVLGREEVQFARPRLATNRHAGFAWRDFCYADDQVLLSLQNYTRHAMLMQAVGRARLVRNDVEVHVWTNVPVPGAEVLIDGCDRCGRFHAAACADEAARVSRPCDDPRTAQVRTR